MCYLVIIKHQFLLLNDDGSTSWYNKLEMKFNKTGEYMKNYLENIRKPQKRYSITKMILITLGIILFGFLIGVFQKWLDSTSIQLPLVFEWLDIRNYFGRLAVWILLATIISIYSESALRASINTFFFFISMLAGYYLYCNYVLGFLPVMYMIFWIGISIVSFFLAYICWYAKGEGWISIAISSMILGVLLAQAIIFTQGIYITNFLEVITWIIGVFILYRSPKEFPLEMGLSLLIAVLYQLMIPYFG